VTLSAYASVQIDFFDTGSFNACTQPPIQSLSLKGDNSCETFTIAGVVFYAMSYCKAGTCDSIQMSFYASPNCPGIASSTQYWSCVTGCSTSPSATACTPM
jgi:hypothetical protein